MRRRILAWVLVGLSCAAWAEAQDIPTIVRQSTRAIVLIVASDKTGKETRQGSGFLVSSDGKVVTNYHVIAGASSAIIKFPTGAFYLVDGVLATDQTKDIAVLKASGKDFPFLSLGNSDELQVGQDVLAIGSPLALEATVSNGIVSSIRELEHEKVIQTTAPISPGSSGGALLNLRGEVIGVTAFQTTEGQNLNFAIPANYIKPLLANERLIRLGQESGQNSSASLGSTTAGVWTSMMSGRDYKIRVDGDYMYVEWLMPERLRDTAAFSRAECRREGSVWSCHWNNYFPVTHHIWGSQRNETKWCRIEQTSVITSVSPQRIEGEADTWEAKDLDTGKCQVKRTTRKSFVWIPK